MVQLLTDILTPEQRSYCMSQIKGKNTKAELLLRKMIWNAGQRGYRVHAKITGKPDMVFAKKKLAIFVDGCFWHKCSRCFVQPKNNRAFWKQKIAKNVARDRKVNTQLKKEGWRVLRFWEHQIFEYPANCLSKVLKNLAREAL